MSTLDERRRLFAKYKEDVKKRGQAVLPGRDVPRHGDEPRRRRDHHRARDRLARDGATAPHGRAARQGVRRQGRPGHVLVRPAARLVLLLPLLPAADLQVADSVILGTVGIPTICSSCCSRCRSSTGGTERRLSRRPVAIVASILVVISMGVLTWKGATATESLASENIKKVPSWVKQNKLPREGDPGRGPVRQDRLPELPLLPRHGRRLSRARPISPRRVRREGHRVPDPASEGAVVGQPRLADAVVRRPRRRAAARARRLPRSVQGRQIRAPSRPRRADSRRGRVPATPRRPVRRRRRPSNPTWPTFRTGSENHLPPAAVPGASLFARIGA